MPSRSWGIKSAWDTTIHYSGHFFRSGAIDDAKRNTELSRKLTLASLLLEIILNEVHVTETEEQPRESIRVDFCLSGKKYKHHFIILKLPT